MVSFLQKAEIVSQCKALEMLRLQFFHADYVVIKLSYIILVCRGRRKGLFPTLFRITLYRFQ